MIKRKFLFNNSQKLEFPIIYQNISYQTVEHYYQAMKILDITSRKKIATQDTPIKAKEIVDSLSIRENWNEIKLDVMANGLYWKFYPCTSFFYALMNYPYKINQENEECDNFWGNCTCSQCDALEPLNHLGKLLTILRESYKPQLKMTGRKDEEEGEYVGRPTVFGNQWSSKKVKNTLYVKNSHQSVLNYLLWIKGFAFNNFEQKKRIEIINKLSRLKDQKLLCWCRHSENTNGNITPCHADLLVHLSNNIIENKKKRIRNDKRRTNRVTED